jgi:hypothetical protein
MPIFDEVSRTATAIDLILWDVATNRTIVAEIKTGQNTITDFSIHDGCSFMTTNDDLLCIKDTALNRASIQLLFSLYVLATRYGVDVEGAVVIRTMASAGTRGNKYVCPNPNKSCSTVQIYKLRTWIRESGVQLRIYACIVRCRLHQLYQRMAGSARKKGYDREEDEQMCGLITDELRFLRGLAGKASNLDALIRRRSNFAKPPTSSKSISARDDQKITRKGHACESSQTVDISRLREQIRDYIWAPHCDYDEWFTDSL